VTNGTGTLTGQTALTISAPSSVKWGVYFNFSGTLWQIDNIVWHPYTPVSGQTIYLQLLVYIPNCHRLPGSKVCVDGPPGWHVMWENETTASGAAVTCVTNGGGPTSSSGSYGIEWIEQTAGIRQYRAYFPGGPDPSNPQNTLQSSYSNALSLNFEFVHAPPAELIVTIRKWDTTLTWTPDGCLGGLIGAYTNYILKGRLFFKDGMPATDDLHLRNTRIRIKKVQRIWDDAARIKYHDVPLPGFFETETDKNGYFRILQNDASGTYVYTAEFDGNEYLNASASGECVVRVS